MDPSRQTLITAPPLSLRLRSAPALRSRSARGDPAAFAALYQRHHRELYRYCRAILRNDHDAQDALQSTMAKAFAALQRESRDFELRPWLFRIAHNEAISIVRRRRDATHLDAAPEAAVDSLPGAVADRQRLSDLCADLADLPERQRSALVLRELNGLGHREIADVLASSPRAVKQAIFEARAALNECADGREMGCAEVQRALSDADGRVLRGRRIRAHLRSCRSCQRFKTQLATRPADLRALVPPLPAGAGASLLAALLETGQETIGGGGAAAGGALAGGGSSAATGAALMGGGAAAAGGAGAGLAAKVAVVASIGAVAAGGATLREAVRAPEPLTRAPVAGATGVGARAPAPGKLGAAPAIRRSDRGALPPRTEGGPARPRATTTEHSRAGAGRARREPAKARGGARRADATRRAASARAAAPARATPSGRAPASRSAWPPRAARPAVPRRPASVAKRAAPPVRAPAKPRPAPARRPAAAASRPRAAAPLNRARAKPPPRPPAVPAARPRAAATPLPPAPAQRPPTATPGPAQPPPRPAK